MLVRIVKKRQRLVIVVKTNKECKLDPIKFMFLYYMHQHFKFFCKYWPDDGLLSLKLVVNNNNNNNVIIIINI